MNWLVLFIVVVVVVEDEDEEEPVAFEPDSVKLLSYSKLNLSKINSELVLLADSLTIVKWDFVNKLFDVGKFNTNKSLWFVFEVEIGGIDDYVEVEREVKSWVKSD